MNEEAMAFADAKVEDGQILFGYVTKETEEVEVHSWLGDSDSETVKRRLREFFPHAEYLKAGDGEKYKL